MNLTAEVKQKNNQLSLQCVDFQQHLKLRMGATGFGSLITFVFVPLVVGVMAGIASSSKCVISRRLRYILFSGFRLLSFFKW